MRLEKEKRLLIEKLEKTPVIQIVCQQTGIGRATYYRWRKNDKEFAKTADIAIEEGNKLINDMAESQIISGIQEKDMRAIIFWLRSHHPVYANRIEIRGHIRHAEELTSVEKKLIRKALRLALPKGKKYDQPAKTQ